MDAELLQLQRLFEAAQQAKASVRLSERNVVELVTKLQDLGLLPPLLHTVTGKEYLTQEQLRYEMELEIKRLGRLSLIDLANTIGVDLFYCEKQAESIISACPNLMLVQGEIISTSYWDAVAEEINESLQETGQVSLAELAARLSVGSDTLTAMLGPRMGNLIQGKLEGGQLYTQVYVARLRAMIRGAVRGLMVPTNLATVWACLQQQLLEVEGNSGCSAIGEGKLFQSSFNGLLKEGAFSGSLRAGGSVWTPAVFEKAQHEGVEAFYSQNSYISYDMLRKLAITQPKQFLQGKYPDGIALETVFMHSSFISMVDAAVEEAIDGGGWLDCVSLVPSSFSLADVARLVSFCPYIQKAGKEAKLITVAETCIVSTSFLKVLLEKLELEVKDLVSLSAEKKSDVRFVPSEATDVTLKGNISQGKSGKRKGGSVASSKSTTSEAGEDDYTVGKGSKGKKRGGKSKSGNQSTVALSNRGGKGNSEKASSREEDTISEDFLATRILELFPELEGAGMGDDGVGTLSKSVAAHLRPSLLSIWETAKQASFSAASEDRRHRADALQKKTDEEYASFQLFAKALDLFHNDHVTLTALHRHLLRTTASELVDVILQTQELERRLENGEISEESLIRRTEPLNGSERLFLAKGFDGALTTKCVKMVEVLEGKAVEEFELALQDVADECGLRLKKLDKKAERALLSTYRKELVSQIESESDPVTLLPKVVALLFTQVYNKALQAPGRTIGSAITHLKKMISEDAYAVLVEYQSATVALLSMLSTSTPGVSPVSSFFLVLDSVLEMFAL
ncbi:hypothetical protein GOP47_0001810 [Adiantum capillus-veneris]|uniref:E3 UFM1-protein ligase 1 homolog n=1 Tax=Adiantum capillus-veneris TaxID=13818 RepID=A0A9D4V9J0_ADICA|nr:hypothetical protein GOP47_0001810 [Adiantum capillus-veneris]